jgi:hypothetical protein
MFAWLNQKEEVFKSESDLHAHQAMGVMFGSLLPQILSRIRHRQLALMSIICCLAYCLISIKQFGSRALHAGELLIWRISHLAIRLMTLFPSLLVF